MVLHNLDTSTSPKTTMKTEWMFHAGLICHICKPLSHILLEWAIAPTGLAWLKVHPLLWNDEYVILQEWVKQLPVVNDSAERAVKNAEEMAMVTRDPDHRDNVILVMNDHRGRVSNHGDWWFEGYSVVWFTNYIYPQDSVSWTFHSGANRANMLLVLTHTHTWLTF